MRIFALGFFDNSNEGIAASNNLQSLFNQSNKPSNLGFIVSDSIPTGEFGGYYGTPEQHSVIQSPTIILLGEYEEQTDTQNGKYREVGRLNGFQSEEDIRNAILRFKDKPDPVPLQEGEGEIQTDSGIGIAPNSCPVWIPKFLCFGLGGNDNKILSWILMLILIFFIYKMIK